MREKRYREIVVEPTATNFAAIAVIMQPAFRSTLEALAKEHGNKAGPWLDELEAGLIREAKGTITEGIPIEIEAPGLKAGIDLLQATLDAVRSNLVVTDKE